MSEKEICPICLKKRDKDEFERHHVIARVDGGSDDKMNLLSICASCHASLPVGALRIEYQELKPVSSTKYTNTA